MATLSMVTLCNQQQTIDVVTGKILIISCMASVHVCVFSVSICCCVSIGLASLSPTLKIPPHVPLEIGIQLECFVSYACTPNEFYIQLVCVFVIVFYVNHVCCHGYFS